MVVLIENVALGGQRSVGRVVVDRLLLSRVEMTGTGRGKSRDNHRSSRRHGGRAGTSLQAVAFTLLSGDGNRHVLATVPFPVAEGTTKRVAISAADTRTQVSLTCMKKPPSMLGR
jgi:hypothetical protein